VPRWQRGYLCATCAAIGFAMAYTLCDFGQWTRLWYLPYDDSWVFAPMIVGKVSMGYIGMFLWGVGGAIVGAGAGAGFALVWKRELPRVAIGLLAAWTITAFLLSGFYFTWNLWPF
jgi:hypothetical protein